MLGQPEQDLTVLAQTGGITGDHLWMSCDQQSAKTKPKSLASAPAPHDLSLEGVVNVMCVTTELSWWSQLNS